MKRVAAIWTVLSILILGILVGILATHLYYAKRLREPGSLSEVAGRFFAGRLDRELSLTDEQRAAIDAILEETRHEADALREEVRPRVGALMEEASQRISDVLTPEQRQRFAELRRRHRGRAEHFFLGPQGPPGPPGRRGTWRGRWHDRPPEPPLEEPAEAPEESPPSEPDS